MAGLRCARAREQRLNARDTGWLIREYACLGVLLAAGFSPLHEVRAADPQPEPAATKTADLSPSQVIASTAAAVATAVAARQAEYEADTSRLRAVADEFLRPQFDLEASSRLILKEHWKSATPEQRKRFVAAFYRFLLGSYADALLYFRKDTVTVLPGEGADSESIAKVRTSMKLRDGSLYQVDYAMRRTAAGWKIVDVIAEGVSYVRTYRTDFGVEIRANGLDSLIERLERDGQKKPAPQ